MRSEYQTVEWHPGQKNDHLEEPAFNLKDQIRKERDSAAVCF